MIENNIDPVDAYRNSDEFRLAKNLGESEMQSYDYQGKLYEAQQLAETDSLTQLPNRRGLHRLLHREIELSRRYGRPLSIAYIDADGLKFFNETYGHQAGDELLKYVATILKLRDSDVICRIGGDEFVIILANVDVNQKNEEGKQISADLAERLKEKSKENKFSYQPEDGQPEFSCQACFSIGFASYQPEDTLESLLNRADAAMQADKNARRNADRSLHIRK